MTTNEATPYVEDMLTAFKFKSQARDERGRFASGGSGGGGAAKPAGGGGHTVQAKDYATHKPVTLKPVGKPYPASSVRVDHSSYVGSHGKNPRTQEGGGNWLFAFGSSKGPYKGYSGNLTTASSAARKDAGLLGHTSVHTMP